MRTEPSFQQWVISVGSQTLLTVSVKADLTIQETETPQPEIAYSGFKNSDTAASVFTADNLPVVSLNSDTYTLSSSLPVGEYEMIVSGPEETDNYTVTYVNYPVKLLTVTMLDGIEVINASAPLTVYTLQGVKVKRVKSVDEFNKLDSGIYIVKQGNETFKVHKN